MKKQLLALALVSSLIQASEGSVNNQKSYMNKQTVIALDLHEVVMDRSYRKLLSAIVGFFRTNIVHHVSLLNPFCAYRVYKISQNTSRTSENVYDKLSQYYPQLGEARSEFLDMCNMYDINPEMEQLIDELKEQGYRVVVCSNIGEDTYKALHTRYPEFFNKFEVAATSNRKNEYIRKPNQLFFELFKEQCYDTLGEDELRFIFADDREKNVDAAIKCDIVGIRFENPRQFRDELKKIGITLS